MQVKNMYTRPLLYTPYAIPAVDLKELIYIMQVYANMLDMLDSGVHNISQALKQQKLWDNTLLVFSADNGGTGNLGNNHPLRGHKHDPWEGGTRATAFMAGGIVPAALRGTNSGAKLVHISDWYPTFCNLAGVDPTDTVMFDGKVRDRASVTAKLTSHIAFPCHDMVL